MEKELVELTKKLITYKTVTGNQRESQECLGYIRRYLKGLSIREVSSNTYRSLIVSNTPFTSNKKYDILLHGHIDVVPANDKAQFIPVVKNGRVFGRGALDMKGGVACLIQLMKNMRLSPKRLLLIITSDEEIGGAQGTEHVLKKLGYRGNVFITAEGEKEYYLKTEQKGVYMFRLNARGTGDHSAYTWNNGNAILHLFDAYKKIEKSFPHTAKDEDHWYSTINMGQMQGGTMKNSIPDRAVAELDIRFCGKVSSVKKVQSIIEQALKNDDHCSYEKLFSTEMMKTDTNNRYMALLNSISKKHLKRKRDLFFRNHGTNDARFASDVGIPAVGFGPIGNNYHAEDEYVSIESLTRYYEIMEEFIRSS